MNSAYAQGTNSMIPDDLAKANAFFSSAHPLFSHMGISVVSAKNGTAEMKIPFNADLADEDGAMHAGAIVTLLDTTCGLAVFSALDSMQPIATIDLRIDMVRPVPAGQGIKAVVVCEAIRDCVAYISGKAYGETGNEPLVIASGSFATNTMGPAFDTANMKRASL